MSSRFEDAVAEVAKYVKILHDERIRQGYSQRKLASLAGIDHAALNLIESGKRNPTLATLLLLQEALRENDPGFCFFEQTQGGL